MISLLFVAGFSLLICVAIMPLARRLALRLGLVDHPDKHRKNHQRVTPVSGGLAVLVAVIAVIAGALFLGDGVGDALLEHGRLLMGLLAGALVICGLGVIDDLGWLRGRHKLLGQLAAVGIVVALGGWVHTVQIFGLHIDLGWLGIPFTLFFMVGAINSLNLIDGMDGLLGSVGVILSLALAAMALLAGHLWAAVVALALAGALVGFLRFNLPPANIFLGDSGSMLVGLILGTLAIHCSLKAPATIALAMPLALMIVPIFDTLAAIIRRKLTGRSIYTTDRGHLHHCLLRSGLSTRWALTLVGVCCVVTCVGVLASQAFNNEWIALITAGSIIAILIITRLFGHAEFMLIKGRLVHLLSPTSQGSQLEVRLQGTAAWKDLWSTLLERAGGLNLHQLLLDVNAPALHEGYHARWDRAAETGEGRSLWHVEIPLTARGLSVGRLVLAGLPDGQPVWEKIAILMKVVDAFNDPPALPHDGVLVASLWIPAIDVNKAAASAASMAPATGAPHLGFGVETLQT